MENIGEKEKKKREEEKEMKNEEKRKELEHSVQVCPDGPFYVDRKGKKNVPEHRTCIKGESNPRRVDGNDPGYHYPINASLFLQTFHL